MEIWRRKPIDKNHQVRMKLAKEADEAVLNYLLERPRSTILEISEGLGWRSGNVMGSLYRISEELGPRLIIEEVLEGGVSRTRYSIKK